LRESLLTKIEKLQAVCRLGRTEILKDYQFDAKRIRRIDALRIEVVHKDALGFPILTAFEDIDTCV